MIVNLLSGEDSAPKDWTAFIDLGQDYYRDGKAGQAYTPAETPGFPRHVVAAVDRFLLACWEQGRKDAGEEATA